MHEYGQSVSELMRSRETRANLKESDSITFASAELRHQSSLRICFSQLNWAAEPQNVTETGITSRHLTS